MDSDRLSTRARAVAEAIRSGAIDQAGSHLAELGRSLPGITPQDDVRAAADILLEARKLAIVHRSQIIQALQSLIRQQLYKKPRPEGANTFQMDG